MSVLQPARHSKIVASTLDGIDILEEYEGVASCKTVDVGNKAATGDEMEEGEDEGEVSTWKKDGC